MGLDRTKPVFGISDKVGLKSVSWKFACRKFRHDTFQKENDKGTDQSGWMGMLVSLFFENPEDSTNSPCMWLFAFPQVI